NLPKTDKNSLNKVTNSDKSLLNRLLPNQSIPTQTQPQNSTSLPKFVETKKIAQKIENTVTSETEELDFILSLGNEVALNLRSKIENTPIKKVVPRTDANIHPVADPKKITNLKEKDDLKDWLDDLLG
ncbi:hypothetical protein HK096_000423, partial [Nowakowskiella sp. JEL0078]